MGYATLAGLLLFGLYQGSLCYLNGFPKEQCDEMDPTKIKIDESMIKAAEADFNNTEGFGEISPTTSLQLSDSLNLYRIVPSATRYRRGKALDITIRGPEFNAVMLQVRRIGENERRGSDLIERVGEFVEWPASLQPVKCDKDLVTAVTNKNYSPKEGITIKWKAPKEDVGDIHVVGRFVTNNEYWQISESREISVSEFPVNLKNCGKAKSCVLYSEKSSSCHEDNCDYILTYSVLNSTTVEFVLGGTSKGDQSYLAVGFSSSPEMETMKMIACSRAKSSAEIKFFVFQSGEDGLKEQPMHLENKKMDLDGNRIWCSFVAPMVTHSEEEGLGLDLSVPLYQAYMRGNTNYTKSFNIPILPSKLLVSKKEIPVDKIKLQYHTMEKTEKPSGANMLLPFQSLLLFVLLYFSPVKKIL